MIPTEDLVRNIVIGTRLPMSDVRSVCRLAGTEEEAWRLAVLLKRGNATLVYYLIDELVAVTASLAKNDSNIEYCAVSLVGAEGGSDD